MYRRPVGSGGRDVDAIESVVFVPVSSLVAAKAESACAASAVFSTRATLGAADFGAGVTTAEPADSLVLSATGVIGLGLPSLSAVAVTGVCVGADIVAARKPAGATA